MILKIKKNWPILKNFFVPRNLKTTRNYHSSPHNGPIKKCFPKILFFMHDLLLFLCTFNFKQLDRSIITALCRASFIRCLRKWLFMQKFVNYEKNSKIIELCGISRNLHRFCIAPAQLFLSKEAASATRRYMNRRKRNQHALIVCGSEVGTRNPPSPPPPTCDKRRAWVHYGCPPPSKVLVNRPIFSDFGKSG